MAAILIHDTTIVTADEAGSILYDAALVVRDGRIAALGPTTELIARYPDSERVDGRGRAILPGLANTHTHLSRVLARGIYEDNMAEDMIEVMRTALFMERVRRQDGRRPTPEEVLTWATRNGYRALGIPDGGWLAPGNRADLIAIDLRKPHVTPALRVVSCLVHQGQVSDVEAVMVDGRWIMRDRCVVTLDEAAIVAEADRIARAAWRRLFEHRPGLPRPPGLDVGTR